MGSKQSNPRRITLRLSNLLGGGLFYLRQVILTIKDRIQKKTVKTSIIRLNKAEWGKESRESVLYKADERQIRKESTQTVLHEEDEKYF